MKAVQWLPLQPPLHQVALVQVQQQLWFLNKQESNNTERRGEKNSLLLFSFKTIQMSTVREYLKEIVNPHTDASAKRFVTLFLVFHFAITAFLVTFFVFYLILFTPKGSVNPLLVSLLSDILETDKWVMLGGLGFITAEGLTEILVKKYTKVSSMYDNFIDPTNRPIVNKEGEVIGSDI